MVESGHCGRFHHPIHPTMPSTSHHDPSHSPVKRAAANGPQIASKSIPQSATTAAAAVRSSHLTNQPYHSASSEPKQPIRSILRHPWNASAGRTTVTSHPDLSKSSIPPLRAAHSTPMTMANQPIQPLPVSFGFSKSKVSVYLTSSSSATKRIHFSMPACTKVHHFASCDPAVRSTQNYRSPPTHTILPRQLPTHHKSAQTPPNPCPLSPAPLLPPVSVASNTCNTPPASSLDILLQKSEEALMATLSPQAQRQIQQFSLLSFDQQMKVFEDGINQLTALEMIGSIPPQDIHLQCSTLSCPTASAPIQVDCATACPLLPHFQQLSLWTILLTTLLHNSSAINFPPFLNRTIPRLLLSSPDDKPP